MNNLLSILKFQSMTKSQLIPGTIVAHYKHNPQLDSTNYTYKIIGIAKHTETDELMVVYLPCYPTDWLDSAEFAVRPLKIFCDNLEVNGEIKERFRVISEL